MRRREWATFHQGVYVDHTGALTWLQSAWAAVLWNRSPPQVRPEYAAVDVAAVATTDFDAVAVLAKTVQSRRTTARRLQPALAERERLPRRRWLAAVLADVAEGTCSVLELEYLRRVERADGLPRARRQQVGVGRVGRV